MQTPRPPPELDEYDTIYLGLLSLARSTKRSPTDPVPISEWRHLYDVFAPPDEEDVFLEFAITLDAVSRSYHHARVSSKSQG